MSDAPRILVIGGGIAGLTIAWELGRGGAAVVLVRSSRPRTSLVAAGMLAPMPESGLSRPITRLASEALRHYPAFLLALGEDSPRNVGFVRSGVLRIATSEEAAAALREEAGTYEAAGLPSQWLSRQSTLALAPGLASGVMGGLHSFDEAQVQPEWLLAALEEAAPRRGVELVDAEVGSVVPRAGGVDVELDTGGRLGADLVVLAAGSWSAALGGPAVPVRPVKGQLLAFRDATGPAPILYADHNYLLTKADGTVILGGTMEEAGFSLAGDSVGEGLRGLLPGLWPGLADAPAELRVGLRPATPDGLPIVGALPGTPSVYAFTAHFRNGFLLCPHEARLAASEILQRASPDLLAPLRPRRFEGAALG
ncbi:MAG: glycine oxidase [Chloroflexota bacterium]|nr:glycine oxidase [Chloroflexota bacterium]